MVWRTISFSRTNILSSNRILSNPTSRVSSPSTLSTTRSVRSFSSTSMPSSSSSTSSYRKVLTPSSINPHVKNVEYAVRGELSNRANRYADWIADGKKEEKGLKFDSVVTANIGNPQQQPFLGQKPLTFWRQVAALTEYPDLLENEAARKAFPDDAIKRSQEILHDIGSVGAYSHSKGAASIRKHVAEFIQNRDGHPSDPELIYLTSGASGGVSLLMSILISSSSVGVMIPIPQYPLYSATLSLYDAKPVRYELNSDEDWGLDVNQMKESLSKSKKEGVDVRGLVIINPGNPTGSCLSEENIKDVIKLAHEENLVIFADEVYQNNIYQPNERPFMSFKKVLKDFEKSTNEQEKSLANDVELISFHSISKGVSGECGRRGGYFELTNISSDVESEIYKMASVSLCPSLQGQIGVDLLVKPPSKNDPSYNLYQEETRNIHQTLKERSEKMRNEFEKLPNMKCSKAQGALYLFPEIQLPRKALEAAKKENDGKGIQSDLLYCFELLDATGICVVPGSGFGKMPSEDGKAFFRTTVLAKETDEFVERFGKFHNEFMKKYAD